MSVCRATEILLLVGLAACGPAYPDTAGGGALPPSGAPSTASPQSEPLDDDRPQGPWTTCYANFTPSGNAEGDLGNLTRACGPQGGMEAVTPVEKGSQQENEPVDRFTFYVPKAGNCYRVYAAGDSGVRDLDLLLRNPNGEPIAGDVTDDSWPVLPPAGPICFNEPGLYLLEVSVYQGSGKYAIQVWGSEGRPVLKK